MESKNELRVRLRKEFAIELCETQIENLEIVILKLEYDGAYDYLERLNRRKELEEQIELKKIELMILNEGVFMPRRV